MISVLGVILGYMLGHFTKEELSSAEKYFRVFEAIILVILCISLVGNRALFSLALIALALSFFRFGAEFLLFGFIAVYGIAWPSLLGGEFLNSALIFLYGLPYGSQLYLRKRFLTVILCVLLFIIGAVVGILL